jgi:hypothetical protein
MALTITPFGAVDRFLSGFKIMPSANIKDIETLTIYPNETITD